MICDAGKKDYDTLIDVWEKSVRATHHFLQASDVAEIKQQVMTVYFDNVTLTGYQNGNGDITGFSGVSGQKLEMLFILPGYQGQGIGSDLCRHAIKNQDIRLVDVNEQNPHAIKFYEKMGFIKIGRSSVDGEGRPYPLVHLALTDVN